MLGQTLDDAAGEALDKGARLLGLGYPGGPAIERAGGRAATPSAFEFPVAMARDPGLDFSFSGLKTALLYAIRELDESEVERRRADLAASYQAAVVGQLVAKLERALEAGEWEAVALGGGVAANALLGSEPAELCAERGLRLKLVPAELCTDNAAMIASAARFLEPAPYPEYLGWDAARMTVVTLYTQARVPPLRRGARGDPGAARRAAAVRAQRGRHRAGRRPASPATSSGSRWSRWTARSSPSWSSSSSSAARPVSILSGDDQLRRASRPDDARTAVAEDTAADLALSDGDRLSLGVAARLSRYLQVLIQARKMGKETISSQELAEYTHINSTQIRRDLSGFGKFGKRGVGYRVDSLVEQIRKILRSSGQHNIVLFGAGQPGPGDRQLGHLRRPRLPDRRHLRRRPEAGRQAFGDVEVHGVADLERVVEEQDVVVGVLAVPSSAAQDVADRLVERRRARSSSTTPSSCSRCRRT